MKVARGYLFALATLCTGACPSYVGAFEIKPGARLHLDQAWHDSDTRPLKDDFTVRRARVGLDGKLGTDWSFEIAYELADDGSYKDVALRYEGWRLADITVGQFKVPFGLEELISSNNTLFVERALPGDAFGQARRVGIGFDRSEDRYTLSLMGFGRSIDGDEGRGAGARFTFLPIRSERSLLHVGTALTTERPAGEVDFKARPESRPTGVRFVNTGDMDDVGRIHRLGLELAWQAGPFTAQAEWMGADVERRSRPDAKLSGWYAAGSWMLTGEPRRYKSGVFKSVTPGGRFGAWELGVRYSHLDLDDGLVRGGTEDNVTLGLNWYAGEHIRVLANYIKVRSERRGISDDPDILLMRVQFVL